MTAPFMPARGLRCSRKAVGSSKARVLRGLAFAICGVLGLAMVKGFIMYAVMCAIVGLFVATASRDVIAVVEKARR